MGQGPIDWMTAHVADVQPDLGSVASAQELRAWAEAVVDTVGSTSMQPTPRRDSRTQPEPCRSTIDQTALSSRSMGTWELRLTEVLKRLRARGELPPEADVMTLGAAFAALLYGGLLLGQTSGDRCSLRVALDMAMTQVCALSLHAYQSESHAQPRDPVDP